MAMVAARLVLEGVMLICPFKDDKLKKIWHLLVLRKGWLPIFRWSGSSNLHLF